MEEFRIYYNDYGLWPMAASWKKWNSYLIVKAAIVIGHQP